MKVRVENKNILQITDCSEHEYEQIHFSFNKQVKDWRFKKKHWGRGGWDGYIKFIDSTNRIPIGLWGELQNFCKEFKFDLEIEGLETVMDMGFDEDHFNEWALTFFENCSKKPRDYQIAAAVNILKYRRCIAEMATSSGKTLIFFMILAYLKTHGLYKNMLLIVPSLSLIAQTAEEIEDFAEQTGLDIRLQLVHGGTSKRKENSDLVIGTYQTLTNLTDDFFHDFDVVAVDEAHGTKCVSIKTILIKCTNANFRFGMSGSFALGEDADAFTLQSFLGPVAAKISAQELIRKGHATRLAIKVVKLNYLDEEMRQNLWELKNSGQYEGSQILALEKRTVVMNKSRLEYTCNVISKAKKNCLVLFNDKKYGYGKNIYNYLRDNTDKEVFYIDGDIGANMRDEFRNRMNNTDNGIMVASYGTIATGTNIPNLSYIFLMESYKSETLIMQTLGRVMRLFVNKDVARVYDFVDDFSWKGHENFCLKHSKERIKLYKREGHSYKIYEVSF